MLLKKCSYLIYSSFCRPYGPYILSVRVCLSSSCDCGFLGASNRPYGQYDYSQPMGYSAPPGMMQPQQPYTGQIYQPTPAFTPASSQSMYSSSFEDEPPLLEGKRRDYSFSKNVISKCIQLIFILYDPSKHACFFFWCHNFSSTCYNSILFVINNAYMQNHFQCPWFPSHSHTAVIPRGEFIRVYREINNALSVTSQSPNFENDSLLLKTQSAAWGRVQYKPHLCPCILKLSRPCETLLALVLQSCA